MSKTLLVSTVGSCIVLAACSSLNPVTNSSNVLGPESARIDDADPANFTEITEITKNGTRIPIYRARDPGDPTRLNEQVLPVVDRQSRIEIRFLRSRLETRPVDLELMVRGNLISEGTEKSIEIRNYAIVGEDSKPATAKAKSSDVVAGLVADLRWVTATLDTQIRAIDSRAGNGLLARQRLLDRNISEAEASLISLKDRYAQTALEVAEARTAVDSYGAFIDGISRSGSSVPEELNQRRQELAERLDQRTLARDKAEADVLELNDSLSALVLRRDGMMADSAQIRLQRSNSAQLSRAQLLANQALIEAPLRAIVDPGNRTVVNALVNPSSASSNMLVAQANHVLNTLLPSLRNSANADTEASRQSAVDAIDEIASSLRTISQSMVSPDSNTVKKLIAEVKDTDVLISETGARPGDVVTLTISNGADGSSSRRTIKVPFSVDDLGLLPSIGEAFSLVNRIPRSKLAGRQEAIDSLRRSFSARGLETGLSTADSVMSLPVDPRWSPAYSFTSGWIYRGRPANPLVDNTGLARLWKNSVSWLKPSFGLQVGLPKFSTQRVTFNRALTVTTSNTDGVTVVDTVVAVGDPKIEDVNRGIEVSVGGFMGLWANTVVVGYGRHLTADDPARYLSVGLSFVKIAQAAIQAVGQ